MSHNNGGPPCPKTERLEELIDFLTNMKSPTGDQSGDAEVQECVEALDWLHTMLSNRKVYQKKQQVKKAVYFKLAKQMLSKEEMDDIDRQVNKETAEVVANEG